MATPNIQLTFSDFIQLGSLTVIFVSIGYGLVRGIGYFLERKARKLEEYFKSFDAVVAQLSSSSQSSQLAAAVLLRRYFSMRQMKKNANLRAETVNVISALLRVLPVGVFQKTLGDSLAYATELSVADLQHVNLQDVYLGVKDERKRILLRKADLYMADLSYALLERIDGREAIFYRTVLFNARIKNCDFQKANFREADLKGVRFANVLLQGADFTGATNVPIEIRKLLVNGVVECTEKITTQLNEPRGKVFFSMPGCLGKREEALTKAYKSVLESEGYEVIYYQKDDYPEFGQFTKIKESIKTASAMIAFGFRQAKITAGTAFPGTVKESPIKDKWSHTPWNEVEVGMALMHGLPVLLVKDEGIDSGIFDSKLSEAFVATILADYDSRKIDTNKDFAKWLSQIGKPCDLNGILFHQPRCSYSEKTPGYVDIGVGERVAVLQGGAAHGRKAILYCHGNGEDIHESTKAMADFIPPGVFFAAVAYAGYGLSDGEQSEVGCYKNAHRLYDWLRTERGFAPEDILVVGYSLGTGVALELASTCRVRAVLLQAPYLSGRSLIEYWYPELAQKLLKDVNPFPSNEYLEKVTCPVAAIHGTGDDVVPLVQGQTLYDMVRVKAGFVAVQDAGHGNVLATLGAPRYKEIIDGLFART